MVTPADIGREARKIFPRLQEHLPPTPVIPSQTDPQQLAFKCENFQKTGSFKIRGALSKLSTMLKAGQAGPFITASSGNHGIACATAAQILGADLKVFLPVDVDPSKHEKIRSFGVETELVNGDSGMAEQAARSRAEETGQIYISPYNDIDIIKGQASCALELLEQMKHHPAEHVFVSIGGGGLISGIASILKDYWPKVKIWGISAVNSAAMATSIEAGALTDVVHLPTFADGVAGGIDTDAVTFPLCQQLVDKHLIIDEAAIAAAFQHLAFEEGLIVEGAAALAYAGWQAAQDQIGDQKSLVVLCGRNVSRDRTLTHLQGQGSK